ncbi:MAG: 50S ribosomal protein L22 [Halobacteriovoraceae bacterium]|nr:50S ribosomal protein L22 [Halobacteriovoraceae bacterium]
MSFVVRADSIGIAPRKIRQVCDLIRSKKVSSALDILRFCPKREIALVLTKMINSALDIATKKEGTDIDLLAIKTIFANEGNTLKRYRPRAQGSAFRIRRRTGHITIKLEEVKG